MCAGVSLETYCVGYYTSCKRYCPSMSLLACGMVLPLWLPFAILLRYLSLCYILENFPIESLSLLSTPYSLCTLGSANAIMNKRQCPNRSRCFLEPILVGSKDFHFTKSQRHEGLKPGQILGICGVLLVLNAVTLGMASCPSINCEVFDGWVWLQEGVLYK